MFPISLCAFKVIEYKLVRVQVRGETSHVTQMLLIGHVALSTIVTSHLSTFMTVLFISFQTDTTFFTLPILFT